ncbi:WG repeat-containing protein [Butyrivibrio sp. M55]|uniref:WG repeat-containing protein n=1 Tax=Butyrivibrio sp. M55 TaxID=1855323 RepID=UPI0008E75CCD|nr:WG repeat-containing protein [Butyrivibrio sp. M55]SFU83794.1 WG containing repeat-containing protein [Butyrivibrio sp. M55]
MKKVKFDKKMIFWGVALLVVMLIFNIVYWHNRALKDGYYYIDIKGNIVSGRYEQTGGFRDGIAVYSEKKGDLEEHFCIDTDFKVLGDKITDWKKETFCIYDGEIYFSVMKEESIDLMDKGRNTILSIPYVTKDISDIKCVVGEVGANGLFAIKDFQSGKWGYMDLGGNMVIVPQFSTAGKFNEDNVAVVSIQGGMDGVIDSKGNYKIEPSFLDIELYGSGIAIARKTEDEAAQFIDLDGNVLSDKQFDYYAGDKSASEGFIPVKKYNRFMRDIYGYVDLKMNYLIEPCEPRYADADDFSHGMAVVTNADGLQGYVDTTGKEVIPCQYEYAGDFGEYDLAAVKINGKMGLIRKDGSFFVNPDYDTLGAFSSGYSVVYLHKGQKVKLCK